MQPYLAALIRHRSKIAFVCARYLIAVFLAFEWVAVLPYGMRTITYYDELADAFLAGQTSLLRAPPAGLMAMPDPWDPTTTLPYRDVPSFSGQRYTGVLDLALYKGRFYVQWGPVPAFIIMPWRLLVGTDPPLGHVVLIADIIAAFAFAAVTIKLARLADLSPSPFMQSVLLVTFVTCPIWIYPLQRTEVYQVAIYFSQLFISLAALCCVVAFIRRRERRSEHTLWLLGLASALVGLAFNCRIDLLTMVPLLPILAWFWWRLAPSPIPLWRAFPATLALGVPAALLLGGTLAYNQIRFDDAWEFGQNWQLWGGNFSLWKHTYHYLRIERSLPNILINFFDPVSSSSGSWVLFVPYDLRAHQWFPRFLLDHYDPYISRIPSFLSVYILTACRVFAQYIEVQRL